MTSLEATLAETLALLGGVTPRNVTLIYDAVYRHLRSSEAQLLRHDDAATIRTEDTATPGYPVPEDHLPEHPLVFLLPPKDFPFLAYNHLMTFIDAYLMIETGRFDKVASFAVREARSLLLFRSLRRACRLSLGQIYLAAHPAAPPLTGLAGSSSSQAAVAEDPMIICSPRPDARIDIWTLYGRSRDVVDLKLEAPLVNTRTARVPPLSPDSITCNMQDHSLWNEEHTAETLHMLGAAVVPVLVFICPPTFLIESFCATSGGASALRYSFDGSFPTATLQLRDGRSVTLSHLSPAAESVLLSSTSIASYESLTLSNMQQSTTLSNLFNWSPTMLTTLEIELDGRLVTTPNASLLPAAFSGSGWRLCPKLELLRLSASAGTATPLVVPLQDVRSFVFSAFPEGCVPEVALNGVTITY